MKPDLSQPWTGSVPIDSVVPNPDQPRKHFDQEALSRTAASCKRQQIQAINVIHHSDPDRPEVKWMIVDGERRWRGLKGIGQKKIKVIYDPEISAENIFEASIAANFCREGHTHSEIIAAVAKMNAAGATDDLVAELVGKSSAWAANYRQIAALHPELQRKMDTPDDGERKLPMKIALLLCSLPPFSQLEQWDRVSKMPANEAFHKLRTSGKVRHGARRSQADDADYAEGKAAKVLESITALVTLPLPMLKSLSVENLTAIGGILAKVATQLDLAVERFREASKEAGRRAA